MTSKVKSKKLPIRAMAAIRVSNNGTGVKTCMIKAVTDSGGVITCGNNYYPKEHVMAIFGHRTATAYKHNPNIIAGMLVYRVSDLFVGGERNMNAEPMLVVDVKSGGPCILLNGKPTLVSSQMLVPANDVIAVIDTEQDYVG